MELHIRHRILPAARAAALALVAGVLLAQAGCSSHAAGPSAAAAMPPPPEVSVAQVLVRDVRQWDDFTGRVAAVQSVEIRPRVSGYVERVAYTEGREVGKGDLLFVIDPRPYRAQLDKAKADLARARSEAQLARTQDARAQKLVAARAISREESDTRHAAVAQAEAAVHAAEAAVASAALDLGFTEVRAPVAGRTGRAMVTAGNLARADTTLLTTLVSMDPVYVEFDSDEQAYLRYAALARRGERAELRNPVRVGLASEEGYPHAGTVDFVDNRVDPATGTIRARAVLPNPDRVLTPGLFARVQLEGSATFEAMLIDDRAVLTDQDRKYVYVLGRENKALRKDIVTGRLIDGLRVVESGLEAHDAVIVRGMQKVFFPGMPVQPKTVAMDAADAAAEQPVAMR
jgi:multidrug efflux system membrane fusion protein